MRQPRKVKALAYKEYGLCNFIYMVLFYMFIYIYGFYTRSCNNDFGNSYSLFGHPEGSKEAWKWPPQYCGRSPLCEYSKLYAYIYICSSISSSSSPSPQPYISLSLSLSLSLYIYIHTHTDRGKERG